MSTGPGKYDDLCTFVREHTQAEGAIVLVFRGNLGSGFSVQAPEAMMPYLPDMLRQMADEIAASPDVKGKSN